MEALKVKLPEGETYYLVGENTVPLLDVLIFENSISIREHTDFGYTYRLPLDKERSTPELLVFTTRVEGIMSYFTYQIDVLVDLTGDGIPDALPVFGINSGIPILGVFNETYVLKVRPQEVRPIL